MAKVYIRWIENKKKAMKGPSEKLVFNNFSQGLKYVARVSKGFLKEANGNEKLTVICILQLKSSAHSSILFSLNGNANTYTCSSFLDIE